MKEVKEVLAIITLKKLLKLKHVVKKQIFLGWHEHTIQYTDTDAQDITAYYRLFLTQNGFEVFKDKSKKNLFVKLTFGQLIFQYDLEYQELNKILHQLEGNERS